jgi:hypothetical protein
MTKPLPSVTIDPADRTRLVFSQPVTLAWAIAFLWAMPPRSANALRPDPAELAVAGAQRRFILDTSDQNALMGLRQELMNQYLAITPIQAKEPAPLPAWLPLHVREQILGFSLPDGVHRFAGTEPFGDIVVWVRRASNNSYLRAEAYQEFPETIEYYLAFTDGDHWTANILFDVFTRFNAEMSYFVEEKGLSPSEARAEIHRINNEVFKLILEACATIMSTGASISAITSTMRSLSPRILDAARRSMRPPRIRPVNGEVNVGGGFETPGITNLNPIKPGSGGPQSGIPNHVRGYMEEMDDIFEPGSVMKMISVKLHVDDVNWTRAAQAAFNVMPPGGKVRMNVLCGDDEGATVVQAFQQAGFREVRQDGFGPATMIIATR